MIWTETKSYLNNKKKLDEAREYVENELSKVLQPIIIKDRLEERKCFILKDGTVIHIQSMNSEKFCDLVIEYSDNIEQMKSYDTEDGDLFPVEGDADPESLTVLFREMLKEIEGI